MKYQAKSFTKNRSFRDFQAHTHISIKNRYAYFGVCKAANSTIKHYLYEKEYTGTPYKVGYVHNKHMSPMLSPFQLAEKELEEVFYGSYTLFTLVRNPFTRILSCYLDRIKDPNSGAYKKLKQIMGSRFDPDISFVDFLKEIRDQKARDMDSHWRPQIFETYSDLELDVEVLCFENLTVSMDRILEIVKLNKAFEPKVNRSPAVTGSSNKLAQYYDEESIEVAREIYKKDFEKFGYDSSGRDILQG